MRHGPTRGAHSLALTPPSASSVPAPVDAGAENAADAGTGGAADASGAPCDASRRTRLRDLIPDTELVAYDVETLDAKYLRGPARIDIWFEDLVPPELEVMLPTTDAKLNYLSYTGYVAAIAAYAAAGPRASCAHAAALEAKKARFAAVINRFLDLHQILRDT